MALSRQDFAVLAAPFLPGEHEFVNDKIYIKETAVCERIEEVDMAWQWIEPTFDRLDLKTEMATVSGTLVICGTPRFGVGSQPFQMPKKYEKESDEVYVLRIETEFRKSELEKGSTTDCLKRAARLFGIGRYMLECPKDIKGYGSALDAWLKKVSEAQGWSPQYFEGRCFRTLGLVRDDLIAAAKSVPGWKPLTYPQKFELLTEMVAARAAMPATLTA